MFKEFFSREIRAGLSSPMIYIFIFIYTLLCFGAVASDNVVIGGSIGNVFKNSPSVITTFTTVLTLFGLLFSAAYCNNAALRDFNNDFHEIIFSTPYHKSGYFFGRFSGAVFLSTLPFLGIILGVFAGSFIGPLVGWIDPERIGPVQASVYINNYFLFFLPNMFIGGSVIFFLAHKFRSTIISFVGALIIIIGYIISGNLTSDVDNETLAALTDPFGLRAWSIHSKYFTPFEKNTLIPGFDGLLLWNRLIWISFGILITLVSYFTFNPVEKRRKKSKKEKSSKEQEAIAPSPKPEIVSLNFNYQTTWLQFLTFFKDALNSILKSTVFKILFIFSILIILSDLFGGFEYYGLQSYPLTYKMIDVINDASGLFILIILVFFSGELIWRDRMHHINEVINAAPFASFSSLVAKTAALISVAVIFNLFFVLMSVVYQLATGYTRIEPDLYLENLLFELLPGYLLYSCFFIFLQVVINNRYVGYFITVLFIFLFDVLLLVLDIESNMVSLGGTPSIRYSDISGYGPGFTGAMWFNSYWILFGLLLLYKAGMFFTRNESAGFAERLSMARKSFSKKYATPFVILLILWIGTGSFIYYNTQILNTYDTSDERERIQVEYETKYKKYENAPQPVLTAVDYHIQIFPEERDLLVKADMILKNKSSQPVDSIFYTIDKEWDIAIDLEGGEKVFEDADIGFLIYSLKDPLEPGQELKVSITSNYVSKGFENSAGNTSIVSNGTFINNTDILPRLGYVEGYELMDKNDRRKYGLPEKARIPELEENCTEKCMVNYLSNGTSDWVDVETVISTSPDQIAIAPGKLLEEWEENGRRYFRYKVDQRSQDFYSFMSARYEVAKRDWNGIDLEVYYDKKHDYNIEMMLDAMEASLKYYTENFGPYYHQQARIIEFPRYGSFAQAFPGTMPYSESIGFVINFEDTTSNNLVEAVIAHEIAHQWWAHQEIPAKMQGGTMLTESFSEYSSLMVMKQKYDEMQMREFLKYNFERYLGGRSSETHKEVPLYKVENQGHIHYGKGSIVLYALQDYIGEDSLNAALRDFLEEFRYKEPPYPTSLDFLKHLEPRVPDSLQYLVRDWIKEITLYDLRLVNTEMTPLEDGKYEVTLYVDAAKKYADSLGNETDILIDDWVDIGIFSDEEEENLIYRQRVKINKDSTSFKVIVDEKPMKAAIDPRRLLIERIYSDNIKKL